MCLTSGLSKRATVKHSRSCTRSGQLTSPGWSLSLEAKGPHPSPRICLINATVGLQTIPQESLVAYRRRERSTDATPIIKMDEVPTARFNKRPSNHRHQQRNVDPQTQVERI